MDSSEVSTALAKRRWKELEKVEAAMRGFCVGVGVEGRDSGSWRKCGLRG